ncbi:MAG TPA: aminotransferase class IV, partial [Bacteroidales bacterium]|nr:aminotransferase class IV [Bacteroidales bacterium]
RGNSYITPESHSILPSVTNDSLMILAKEMGLTVERRPVEVDELGTFDEVGACGTAAIISPVKKIVDLEEDKIYNYCKDGNPGPVSEKLYRKLLEIQFGDQPDNHGWVTIVE